MSSVTPVCFRTVRHIGDSVTQPPSLGKDICGAAWFPTKVRCLVQPFSVVAASPRFSFPYSSFCSVACGDNSVRQQDAWRAIVGVSAARAARLTVVVNQTAPTSWGSRPHSYFLTYIHSIRVRIPGNYVGFGCIHV